MASKLGSPIATRFVILSLVAVGVLVLTNLAQGQQPYRYPQSQPTLKQNNQQKYNSQQNHNRMNQNPQQYRQPTNQLRPTYNRQPAAVRPTGPRIQSLQNRRPPVPRATFQLTAKEQDYVNRILNAWERYGDRVNTFETKFTLRVYGSVFNQGKPPVPQLGTIKYKKPDKGFFEVTGARPEKWICDGTSLFEYSHTKKEVTQHILPPEERGKAIQNGPLPFLFGAKSKELKQRYWIRALPSKSKDQIWLQAFPKHARDAAEFTHTEMIISAKDMSPIGIMMHKPNGKETHSYVFQNIIVNDRNPLNFFKGDPFKPRLPSGWRKVVDNMAGGKCSTTWLPPSRTRDDNVVGQ